MIILKHNSKDNEIVLKRPNKKIKIAIKQNTKNKTKLRKKKHKCWKETLHIHINPYNKT